MQIVVGGAIRIISIAACYRITGRHGRGAFVEEDVIADCLCWFGWDALYSSMDVPEVSIRSRRKAAIEVCSIRSPLRRRGGTVVSVLTQDWLESIRLKSCGLVFSVFRESEKCRVISGKRRGLKV
jgi:hypothetical protein